MGKGRLYRKEASDVGPKYLLLKPETRNLKPVPDELRKNRKRKLEGDAHAEGSDYGLCF
jgi:hypothetical protein